MTTVGKRCGLLLSLSFVVSKNCSSGWAPLLSLPLLSSDAPTIVRLHASRALSDVESGARVAPFLLFVVGGDVGFVRACSQAWHATGTLVSAAAWADGGKTDLDQDICSAGTDWV